MSDRAAGRRPLSYSQARVWSECRWRYRQQYLRGVTTLVDPVLEFGSIEHEAIRAYVNFLVAERLEYAPHRAPEVFQAWASSYPSPIPDDQYEEVLDVLLKFAFGFHLDWERVWNSEVELAVDFEGEPVPFHDGRAWLRGRADLALVDDWKGEILDWKTGRAALSQAQMARDFQARTYALLFSRMNDRLRQVTVKFYYPRLGLWRWATFAPPEWRETWDRWRAISNQIEAALEHAEDDDWWPPRPGAHCVGCPVALTCPLGMPKIGMALGLPMNQQDRQTLAEMLLVLDAARAAIRKGLRAAVEKEGGFVVGDVRFDFYPDPKWEYDRAKVLQLCAKHFVEPTEIMQVSAEALRRLRKKEPALVAAIEQEARVNVGAATFTYRRVSETAGSPDGAEEVKGTA